MLAASLDPHGIARNAYLDLMQIEDVRKRLPDGWLADYVEEIVASAGLTPGLRRNSVDVAWINEAGAGRVSSIPIYGSAPYIYPVPSAGLASVLAPEARMTPFQEQELYEDTGGITRMEVWKSGLPYQARYTERLVDFRRLWDLLVPDPRDLRDHGDRAGGVGGTRRR